MKSQLRDVEDGDKRYQVLVFICPGCAEDGGSGLHMLPVNTDAKSPMWTFDGNFDQPTVDPSILTRYTRGSEEFVCHSFLHGGVFQFLNDCTHSLKGKNVIMPDLPDWVIKEDQ